jgi:miniconductance mechanosensitive channel
MLTASALKEQLLRGIQLLDPNLTADGLVYNLLALSLILVIALVVYGLCRLILQTQVQRWVSKTSTQWDDSLQNHGFFSRLVLLAPAVIIYLLIPVFINEQTILHAVLSKLSLLYMLFVALVAFSALLNTVEDWYNTTHFAQQASITGFIQVAKLLMSIVVILLSISLVVDRSPLILLSGLTAIAAILLLIFRDTILGFVAGIQIAANRMFNNGDWIQIDKYGVDGEIKEIGLTNVKVQNWDNTISTLPTYTLTNESIKNWRGMSESGGRRIKRALYIDIHSISLCDKEMLDTFAKIRHISHYIKEKVAELQQYHKNNAIDESDLLNRRTMTNIGTFRAYLVAYLRHHPKINQNMTLMVRQLPPTEFGLPLEIYCFSADKAWVNYEQIQSDIFDHILAMLPSFRLRAFQRDSFQINYAPPLQDGASEAKHP